MPMQRIKKIRVPRNCRFCKEKTEPNFREVGVLADFLSERGRILGKDRTGVCAKHQRRISREIKRARQVALLPFVSGF